MVTIDENSYAISSTGVGLQFEFGTSANCTGLSVTGDQVSGGVSFSGSTGTMTLYITPSITGSHMCTLTVTDHAGLTGSLTLPTFSYRVVSLNSPVIVTPTTGTLYNTGNITVTGTSDSIVTIQLYS